MHARANSQAEALSAEARRPVLMVATAMHEMNATAQEVTRHAGSAASAANDANRAAQEGETGMTQTIATIERMHAEITRTAAVIARLEHDSERIGSVLEVIRGIADQTNLLALNAALEAARAGTPDAPSPWWPMRCAAWRCARPAPSARSIS